MLDIETPPEDPLETMAAEDDEKLRNIARIESALEILGVLVIEKMDLNKCEIRNLKRRILGECLNR